MPTALNHVIIGGQGSQHRTRMRNSNGHDFFNPLRRKCCCTKGRKRAPIVSNDTRPLRPQGNDQLGGILREEHRLIPAVRRRRRWRIAAHKWGDCAKAGLSQRRQELPIRVGVIGEAMQTQHQRPFSRFETMKLNAIGIDRVRSQGARLQLHGHPPVRVLSLHESSLIYGRLKESFLEVKPYLASGSFQIPIDTPIFYNEMKAVGKT